MNPLSRAIEAVPGGRRRIAKACAVSYQAVQKWEQAGRLPRSEFSGETAYAKTISAETKGAVTESDLLDWSRDGWNTTAA